MTNDKNQILDELQCLIKDLQTFIELSFKGGDLSTLDWIKETSDNIEVQCWERKKCGKTECPAHGDLVGRCWLVAGTMCGDVIQGKFAEKYGSCIKCDVYQENIGKNKVRQLRELLISLTHSLRLRQEALEEAQSEIKVLSGLLPICAACKKIRDDKGYWSQIESFISKHSEAEFTHSICPECVKKLYPYLSEKK